MIFLLIYIIGLIISLFYFEERNIKLGKSSKDIYWDSIEYSLLWPLILSFYLGYKLIIYLTNRK